jgi:hypothetical protein
MPRRAESWEFRSHFPTNASALSTESIYQAIYDPRTEVIRPAKRRRRPVQGLERRGRITNTTMIAIPPSRWTIGCKSGIEKVIASWVAETVRR